MSEPATADQGYLHAYQLWVDYYESAERSDRAGPHSPPRYRGDGVMPRPDAGARRSAKIRELSEEMSGKMRWVAASVVEQARRAAIEAHDRWLKENPCPCRLCSERWP